VSEQYPTEPRGQQPGAESKASRNRRQRRNGAWKQAITRVVIVLAVLLSFRYFYWRATETMNPLAKWFFYVFLVAELLNFLENLLFYVTTWRPKRRARPETWAGQNVDVFILTYNEPVDLVRETAVCAVNMRYPHKTYLLDDGNREAMRALAEELGCIYLARTERTHAKAGNLNHGLGHSDGEFIVTLDADHVPMPDLIERLIGFFRDPSVAVVQTAQDFYNLDSYQHLTQWERKYAWQQQELFFSVIQPGKDSFGAAFYCGSPAMLRRRALEEIGGFATGTVTEDVHTGLRLQKRGWQVAYYNHTVARGLAPQTFPGFATQWYRWGYGAMQVLRQEHPLLGRGLNLGQRLCYFASFYFYWVSFQKLLYVLTPIFCLATGIFPLVAMPKIFAMYFVPYFLLSMIASALLQGGLHGYLLSEQFNVVKLPVLMRSVAAGLFGRESIFRVTPKSRAAAASPGNVILQLVLIAGLAAAVGVGGWRLASASPGYYFWAIALNILWALFYLELLLPTLWRALKRQEQRITYRFPGRLEAAIEFSLVNPHPDPASEAGFARNLSRHGFSITRDEPIPIGALVDVELALPTGAIHARARVMRNETFLHKGRERVASGLQFEQIDSRDQDAISKYLFWTIAPQHGQLLHLTQSTQKESEHGTKGDREA
jgi:cellulose synthase/poly-beta-1,6-N-acetylglucosamine synthase-like glycosyltransferase